MHRAMAAVMNAVGDLAAWRAGKPLSRLLVHMMPEQPARFTFRHGKYWATAGLPA